MLFLLACADSLPSPQTYGDVPVFGTRRAVLDDGHVIDDTLDELDVDAHPSLDPTTARWIAGVDGPADLWILRHAGRDHLTWRVRGQEPPRPVVFVDAHDGRLVWTYDDMQTASGDATYSGAVSIDSYKSGSRYYLEDSTRALGTYSYGETTSSIAYVTDGDNRWTSDDVAVQAHYDAEVVHDYFLDRFGRDGVDGSGGPGEVAALDGSGSNLASYVHYDEGWANAMWDGGAMVYGDGDGVDYGAMVALDIAGHEFTHGVTQYTAGLVYSGESGAINESMSDVFGAMVEAYDAGAVDADTWTLGEDVVLAGGALRWMDDPAADGVSLDYWSADVASADVHEGSGVGNLAYYLLVEGGAHPRRGGSAVSGIGTTRAEQIWYRALTRYLTPSSTYADARAATLQAAADLYGAASGEYASVDAAWAAVGVGGSSATGTLSATGDAVVAASFTLDGAGRQTATLSGPSGSNFDLYLQKWKSGSWSTVKSAKGSTSTESLTYSGKSGGDFRYRVKSASGSGTFTLSWTTP